MKLLLENWREFLKEEELIKESVSDHYDTLSEDGLYKLNIEDLLDLRDFIVDFGADQYSRSRDTKNLYPTIMARIEALEGSEAEEATAQIEGVYSGEYAMKLAKAFIDRSKMGIDLASMIPDTEGLVEEFKRLREIVQEILEHAERSDNAPWHGWDYDKHPNSIIKSMGDLMNALTDLPGENVPDMNELVDERKEILTRYFGWVDSLRDLENYTFWQLARKGTRLGANRQDYIDSYHFIKDWVGED